MIKKAKTFYYCPNYSPEIVSKCGKEQLQNFSHYKGERFLYTSWVVQARGPANVRSLPLMFSFRKATNVNRAIS